MITVNTVRRAVVQYLCLQLGQQTSLQSVLTALEYAEELYAQDTDGSIVYGLKRNEVQDIIDSQLYDPDLDQLIPFSVDCLDAGVAHVAS